MALPRPPILPRFATLDLLNGTGGAPNVVEPSSGKKDSGWNEGERPPRETFNWLHRITFDWIEYIDSVIDGVISQFAQDISATSGLNFVVGPGIASIGGQEQEILTNTVLALVDNATNFVWLNIQLTPLSGPTFSVLSADEATVPVELQGDDGTDLVSVVPLFRVVTVAGVITSVKDLRSIITIPFTDYESLQKRTFTGKGKGAFRNEFAAANALPEPDLDVTNFFLLSPNATPGAIVFQTPDNPGLVNQTDPLWIAIELDNSSQTVAWSSSYNFVGDPSNGAIDGANGLSYLAIGFYDPTLLEWKMSLVGSSAGALPGRRGALAFGNNNQSTTTGVELTVALNDESYDTNSVHDVSVNNSRLTVPSGVTKIRLTAQVQFAGSDSGVIRSLRITKNGGGGGIDEDRNTYLPFSDKPAAGATGALMNTIVTGVIATTATDFFEMKVKQNSGGALNLLADMYWFEMEILG